MGKVKVGIAGLGRENRNFILLNEQKTASKWGFSFKVTVRRNTTQGEIYISSVGGNFK